MFAFGVASAFYMPASTKIISLWFDRDELALANGFLTSASPLGQITANFFAVRIMMAIGGWQTLYTLIGISVIVLVIAFFIFGREKRNIDAALSSSVIDEEDLGMWKNIKGVLKVPQVWMYCIANMCFLGMIYAGGAFGQLILQTDPGWMLDKSISGRIPAMNNMTSMFAYIIVPLLIKKIGRQHYRKFAIITGIISPILFYIGYASYNFTTISVMLALAGILYGAVFRLQSSYACCSGSFRSACRYSIRGVHNYRRIGITIFISLLGGSNSY